MLNPHCAACAKAAAGVLNLEDARLARWARLPRVTKPGPAVESDGTRWAVVQVWKESGSALCSRGDNTTHRFAIPLETLREAPEKFSRKCRTQLLPAPRDNHFI